MMATAIAHHATIGGNSYLETCDCKPNKNRLRSHKNQFISDINAVRRKVDEWMCEKPRTGNVANSNHEQNTCNVPDRHTNLPALVNIHLSFILYFLLHNIHATLMVRYCDDASQSSDVCQSNARQQKR